MQRQGIARLGRKTKELVKELKSKEIAIIDHSDLDALGAIELVNCGVSAVINAASSISGRYPNLGPEILLKHNIPIIDNVGPMIFDQLKTGDEIEIFDGKVYHQKRLIAQGTVLTDEIVERAMKLAQENLNNEISKFIDNTFWYIQKEKDLLLGELDFPELKTEIIGKHVVVVVRGLGYKDDLLAISSYIHEMRPVLIAVDGGADALLEFGLMPDIIIGDMDSVSDRALLSKAEKIVHAYTDGHCPAKERMDNLSIEYSIIPAPGTSEDIALLLADEKGAELIVAVGTHSNLIDFLEKGRKGMASTFLTRVKIGPKLMDAKGVSKLYQGKNDLVPIYLVLAALIPIIIFISMSSPWRHFFRLAWLQLRLLIGGM